MTEPKKLLWPFRRLPIKTLYRGVELSTESEELLDEAMMRLNVNDPDEAIKAALLAYLNRQPSPMRETA